MSFAYYNEHDRYAAQWLRNLIAAGHITDGVVDERSIEDVHPDDLKGFTRCHFFAGIGVWDHALALAGYPADQEVWTGSCPCQPFSSAGKGGGFADERHLWPSWFHLIRECRPAVILGEQVASKDAEPWLDLVQDDLEGLGHAFGAIPFPAAGVGAPHIRDRLYWVAYSRQKRQQQHAQRNGGPLARLESSRRHDTGGRSGPGSMADAECGVRRCEASAADHAGAQAHGPADRAGGCGSAPGALAYAELHHGARRLAESHGRPPIELDRLGAVGGVANADEQRWPGHPGPHRRVFEGPSGPEPDRSPTRGFWRGAEWIYCRDGRWRPVEPGTFPLAHGAPARVGRLRAYGNAINAEAARIWVECVMEALA